MVTQQVAISRGINIVLNRAQILGTTSDFDLTPQVVEVAEQGAAVRDDSAGWRLAAGDGASRRAVPRHARGRTRRRGRHHRAGRASRDRQVRLPQQQHR